MKVNYDSVNFSNVGKLYKRPFHRHDEKHSTFLVFFTNAVGSGITDIPLFKKILYNCIIEIINFIRVLFWKNIRGACLQKRSHLQNTWIISDAWNHLFFFSFFFFSGCVLFKPSSETLLFLLLFRMCVVQAIF